MGRPWTAQWPGPVPGSQALWGLGTVHVALGPTIPTLPQMLAEQDCAPYSRPSAPEFMTQGDLGDMALRQTCPGAPGTVSHHESRP